MSNYSQNSRRAFFAAIRANDLPALESLLNTEPDLLNSTNEDSTPVLLFAIYTGQAQLLDFFLTKGVNLDLFSAAATGRLTDVRTFLLTEPSLLQEYSVDGWTALHLACFFGQSEVVAFLLAQGADVKALSRNNLVNTALHAAVANQQLSIIALLLAHGAEVNARQRGGWTPLHAAAQCGNADLINLLLANGAERAARNDDGLTPADIARQEKQETATAIL